jgi:hypothetical protein
MRLLAEASLVALSLLTFRVYAYSQAFVPSKGAGSVSVNAGTVSAKGHFLDDGTRLPGYETRANNVTFSMDYGVTDRLAVGLTLPYIRSKYTGKEEPLNLPINVLDDGAYHGTLQDFAIETRYNLFSRPFVATPFATITLPSHQYDTIGEAAVGPNLKQFTVGLYGGRLLNPVLSRAIVQGSLSHTISEKALGLRLDRSNMDVSAGYFITSSLSGSFLWRRQWMHGGLGFADLYDPSTSAEVFLHSDKLTRQNFQHVGLGAGLTVTESASVSFSWLKFVSGSNSHYGHGISGGISWSFSTRAAASLFE